MKHFSRSNTRGKRAGQTRAENVTKWSRQRNHLWSPPLYLRSARLFINRFCQWWKACLTSLWRWYSLHMLWKRSRSILSKSMRKIEENATKEKWKKENIQQQEPISRNMQLKYIPVTAFPWNDLFLGRIHFEWDSRGSAITSHKTLIDVTASLDRNCLSLTKEKVY